MEKASAALDFERAAIYRDRLAALSGGAVASGHQSARRRGGGRVRRPSGRRLQLRARCSSSAPVRTGAIAPISPRPTVRSRPARCWARSSPSSTTTSRARAASSSRTRSRSARCWPKRLSTKSGYKVEVERAPARREEGPGRSRARQCARGAGAQARRDLVAAQAAGGCSPRPSACRACRGASRSTTTATSRAPTRSAP